MADAFISFANMAGPASDVILTRYSLALGAVVSTVPSDAVHWQYQTANEFTETDDGLDAEYLDALHVGTSATMANFIVDEYNAGPVDFSDFVSGVETVPNGMPPTTGPSTWEIVLAGIGLTAAFRVELKS